MAKSQVSFFLILGLFVVIALGAYIYLTSVTQANDLNLRILELDSQKLQDYTESCLKDVAYEGLSKRIAPQGGYLTTAGMKTVAFQDNEVPFWNAENSDVSPDLGDVKSAFEKFILENISTCITTYLSANQGINIYYPEKEKISVNVTFDDEDTKLKLVYPIKMAFGKSEKMLTNFNSGFDFSFKKDFELAKRILIETLQAQPNFYDIRGNCLNYNTNGFTHIYAYDIDMTDSDKTSIIGVFDYKPTLVEQTKALRLLFAVKNLNQLGYCG